MKELVNEGKVRQCGVSNYASWQILEIMNSAESMGLRKLVVAQQLYNLLIRQLDLEYARFAARYSLHTMVYNALAGGLLSGKHQPGGEIVPGSRFDGNKLYQRRFWTERFLALTQSCKSVAESEGMTLSRFAYAWLGSSPLVDSILIGPATIAQLDEAIEACTLKLSPEVCRRVDEIHIAFVGTDTSYAR